MAALPARIAAGVSVAAIAGTAGRFRNSIWQLQKFLASLLAVDSNVIVATTGQEHEASNRSNTCDEFDLKFDDSPTFEIEEYHDYLRTRLRSIVNMRGLKLP